MEVDHDMFDAIEEFAADRVKVALDTDDKNKREEMLNPIKDDIHAKFDELYPESDRYDRRDASTSSRRRS